MFLGVFDRDQIKGTEFRARADCGPRLAGESSYNCTVVARSSSPPSRSGSASVVFFPRNGSEGAVHKRSDESVTAPALRSALRSMSAQLVSGSIWVRGLQKMKGELAPHSSLIDARSEVGRGCGSLTMDPCTCYRENRWPYLYSAAPSLRSRVTEPRRSMMHVCYAAYRAYRVVLTWNVDDTDDRLG